MELQFRQGSGEDHCPTTLMLDLGIAGITVLSAQAQLSSYIHAGESVNCSTPTSSPMSGSRPGNFWAAKAITPLLSSPHRKAYLDVRPPDPDKRDGCFNQKFT